LLQAPAGGPEGNGEKPGFVGDGNVGTGGHRFAGLYVKRTGSVAAVVDEGKPDYGVGQQPAVDIGERRSGVTDCAGYKGHGGDLRGTNAFPNCPPVGVSSLKSIRGVTPVAG